jgi:hypothetical protein
MPFHGALVGAVLLASSSMAMAQDPSTQATSTHSSSTQPSSTQPTPNDIEARLIAVNYEAHTNLLTAERVLLSVDQALGSASIITSSVKNDHLVHLELKRLASELPGTRAIIVIGPDGWLVHDSYTYPASPINLSDRPYFLAARDETGLHVGNPLVGRTSGAAFVPLAKRLGELTFVAIVSPFALVNVQTECGDCWSLAAQTDGDLIAAFPPEALIAPRLLKTVADARKDIGHIIMGYNDSVVAVAWRKSADYPFIAISVRGLPDTATVEVDLN